MAKDIEDRIVYGILNEETQIFYYLESGMPRVATSIDRLRVLLMQRNIITMMGTPNHKIITAAEAKRLGYKTEPVFTSAHVRQVWEAEQAKRQQKTVGW
jgi:hypothetical protein